MTLKIRECDWEITTRCNLKCKHCLIKKSKAELNTKECIQVIDNLFNLGCKKITFTGGEPLIKKDIMKIIEHSQKKGIENWIFTNGTLINKKNINQIKKFITYIGFSLEGFENENDILRGKGSFKQTLRAITLVKDKNILMF
jgi:MoaA/NifB/PqqE/SkfB family radical SAM enzyme